MKTTTKHYTAMRSVVFVVILIAGGMIVGCSSRMLYNPTRQSVTAASAINVNIATVEELEKLPHIGRKTAEAIVAFREENGPFRRAEHLLLIRGVSEKRFADIRQFISTK